MEVVEYLCRKLTSSLIPRNPDDERTAREVVELFESTCLGPLYGLLKCQVDAEKLEFIGKIQSSLGAIEAMYASASDGPFLLGDDPCIADISVTPFLDRFSATLTHYRDFNPLNNCPRLTGLLTAARERPGFQTTSQLPEFYVFGYQSYAFPNKNR